MSDANTKHDAEPLPSSEQEQQLQQVLQLHGQLKFEQSSLKRQLHTIQLHLSALSIENEHMEQSLEKLSQQTQQKQLFNQNIKQELMKSTHLAVNAQTRITFPHKFLVQIFRPFAEDQTLMEHCMHIDVELAKTMHTLRMQAYQAQELKYKDIIKKKQTVLASKLADKYEAKLSKNEQSQRLNAEQIRNHCFELLQDFLNETCTDKQHTSSYLAELKTLYDLETYDL